MAELKAIIFSGLYLSQIPRIKLCEFMNLLFKKTDQVIQIAYWYPIERVQLREAQDQFAKGSRCCRKFWNSSS